MAIQAIAHNESEPSLAEGPRRFFGLPRAFGLVALFQRLRSSPLAQRNTAAKWGPISHATVAGVFAEAVLVVLVLDQIAHSHARHEWSFVRRVVGERMAASMVDIMRLLFVRWSPLAHSANHERHNEFVEIAELHLEDFRSNLQSLVLAQSHEIS